ncbi:MAG: sensor histidine kinase [Moheibacter sp.]
MESSNGIHKIKPAARLIHTIGSDLIGDSYAALVELVKNSYDADASIVEIEFNFTQIEQDDGLIIWVKDNGHGMSYDTVINKWLVPATSDKLKRKKSPIKNRVLQGRKGIGRFAASMLGQELTLTSIDQNKEKSTLVIDWRVFYTEEFLENVKVLVEREQSDEESGTFIKIIAKNEKSDNKISSWDKRALENLINELRKLISPFGEFEDDPFKIVLTIKNSPFGELNKSFEIKPFPVIDLYDYRISGTIDEGGNAMLLFENNLNPNARQYEKINTHFNLPENSKYCGILKIDYRVFDREPEAIENLINKGLIDPVSQKYMGKNEARRLLNEIYGVNIYKNNFRIRPYGNLGVDWLDLDKDRIQNFTLRISNNQVVGFITIQSEEQSGLEEKSARDGLKENEYYFGLKELAKSALSELEIRRLIIRKKSEKSRKNKNTVQDTLNALFSLDEVKKSISSKLKQLDVNENAIKGIEVILEAEEEKKQQLKQELEKTIAIYQGQATLGKIVNFILHEGRKPIQFFNSETKVIETYIKHYQNTKNDAVLGELSASIDGFRRNSKRISELFKKINPLAKQRRGNKSDFNINKVINESIKIFSTSLEEENIKITIDSDSEISIYGWEEDLFIALTNLIENSIYWLSLSDKNSKEIKIHSYKSPEGVFINYTDNGPGLADLEIESEIIFEPGYSKKLNGTGLGLAISGEAIARLNGKLKAIKYKEGAFFQIEIKQ